MVNLPLETMTRAEKLVAMEALWKDLSREDELLDSPEWHLDELRATMERVQKGEEAFIDWEVAKKYCADKPG